MQRRTISAALSLCVGLSGALAPLEAQAQPAAQAQALAQAKAAAKAAANRGQALYDQGSYEDALREFREAEHHFHAPTFLLMIARAHEKLGRLLAARTYYRQVVDVKLANYAPKVFFDAQEQARNELEALAPRIPTLVVTVTGAAPANVKLIVDGRKEDAGVARMSAPGVTEIALVSTLELDPGKHTVMASALGRGRVKAVVLAEGTRAEVMLALKAPPPPPAAMSPSPRLSPAAQLSEQTETPGRGYMMPAIGALSVSGVALGVGVVTGALSLDAAGSLDGECVKMICYDGAGGETYDRANDLATISTVGFVISGVAAVAGVTLLLWPNPGRAQPRAALRLTPGRVDVQGRF